MSKKRKIVISTAIASFMMLFCYFITNMGYPISGEKTIMICCEYVKNLLISNGVNTIHNDSVTFVNVCYDLELTDKVVDGETIGKTAIVDRKKLYDLLSYLDKNRGYKYLLLDVFFEKGCCTPIDSALFSLINRMPRIVIPYSGERKDTLADVQLQDKAGRASYFPTMFESDFVKYPYYSDGIESLPLMMYKDRDLYGCYLHSYWLWYSDNWRLARRSVILNMEKSQPKTIINLGELVNSESPLIEVDTTLHTSKYIVIGDFFEKDKHNTYEGEIPGSVILFNAYLALLHGQHILSLWIGLVLFLLFIVYAFVILNRTTLYELLTQIIRPTSKWGKHIFQMLLFLIYWFDFPICLALLCAITYFVEGKTYDILITSLCFQFMKFVIDLKLKKGKVL